MTTLTRRNAHELRTTRGPECRLALDDIVYELVHAAPAPTPEEAAIQDETQDHNEEDYTMNQTTSIDTPSLNIIQRNLDEVTPPQKYECGEVVFDLIEDLTSVAQKAAVRALGNTAIARAIHAANWLLICEASDSPKITAQTIDEAEAAVGRWANLAAWAREEAMVLGENDFWHPMSNADMFDYMARENGNVIDRNNALFEARMDLLELDEEEKELSRESRKRKLRERENRNRLERIRRREDILGLLDRGDASQFMPEVFNAREHAALFETTYTKLRNASRTALESDREGAEDDMIDLAAAAKRIDKASSEFRRRNRHELLNY